MHTESPQLFPRLFLGFRVDSQYAALLERVNPNLREMFIKNQSGYLHETTYEGNLFLGKTIEEPVDISSLELFEANIYSLLRKLVSDYPYEDAPLVLFPQS